MKTTKLFHLVLSLLSSFLLSGNLWAQNLNPNGYNVFYYPDSTVSSEGSLRNGQPDGIWKAYYPNGILKSVGKRSAGLLDSVWVFYFDNGDTAQVLNYRADKKNGYCTTYQQSIDKLKNRPLAVELYVNGKKEGSARYFHTNGQLQMEVEYLDGRRQGEARVYNDAGLLIEIHSYKNDFLVFTERINRLDIHGKKQGIWREFYPSGLLQTEMTYRDDLLNGYKKYFDVTGMLLKTERYENGILIPEEKDIVTKDVRRTYFANGQLQSQGAFVENKAVGLHRRFNEQGEVTASKLYSNDGVLRSEGIVQMDGRRVGDWQNLYPGGTVKSGGNYQNGLQTGLWKFFYPNGKLEQEGQYVKGRHHGLWKWYHANGKLWKQENYNYGKRDGAYEEYDPEGKLIAKGSYQDDEREGAWELYIGDHYEKGNYYHGFRSGLWQGTYPDGTLKFKGAYADGALSGEHRWYYPNGKLHEVRNYSSGTEDGRWTKYNENGEVELELIYDHGTLIRIDGEKLKEID